MKVWLEGARCSGRGNLVWGKLSIVEWKRCDDMEDIDGTREDVVEGVRIREWRRYGGMKDMRLSRGGVGEIHTH